MKRNKMKKLKVLALMLVAGVIVVLMGGSYAFSDDAWTEAVDPKNFSATMTFATDYLFRGVSQTDNKSAAQGSFDYKHPIGAYIGIWGSNVDDYISKGNVELDVYGGYGRELFTNLNMDVSLIYYYYPGSGDDPRPSYGEGHLGLDYTFKELPLSPKIIGGYNYSPNFFCQDGEAHYGSGRLDLALPFELTLSGLVGYQWVEGNRTTGHGNGDNGNDGYDYAHWRIGISRPLLGFVLDLSYNDTNNANFLGKQIADERIVFSVSRTF
jgi:uncharacterized protein (TIGR02001 family)